MPVLSFSVAGALGPAYITIPQLIKTQTFRKPRKYPIFRGDTLVLYWKQRFPIELKPVHMIGTAVCSEVLKKKYEDFAFDYGFARMDGFFDVDELQKWCGDPVEEGKELYDVIRWTPQSFVPSQEVLKYC